jgi:hypothetical protein
MRPQDLIELWDEHTADEFTIRDAAATIDTMVNDAYVNHVPVMTGGQGREALRRFYSTDFIPVMPPDTKLTPVSRTVGEDQHCHVGRACKAAFVDMRRARVEIAQGLHEPGREILIEKELHALEISSLRSRSAA